MGRKPIGERAMTDAERMQRWRDRQTRRHAQQPQPRAPTLADLTALFPTQDDWDRWLGLKPWDE